MKFYAKARLRLLLVFSAMVVSFSLVSSCGKRDAGKLQTEPSPVMVALEADESEDDWRRVFPDPSGKAYFPEGKARWYTGHLLKMQESSLRTELPKGTTFMLRFTKFTKLHG